jgi:hypothetical protein
MPAWFDIARSTAKAAWPTARFLAQRPTVIGAGAGAAAGYFLRDRGEDADSTIDRMLIGAAIGGGLGLFTPTKRLARTLGSKAVNHFKAMPGAYSALRADGKGVWDALQGSYMSMPLMMGAGALAGYEYNRRNGGDPYQGILYGAGLGAAAKGAAGAVGWWNRLGRYPGAHQGLAISTAAAVGMYGIAHRDMSTTYQAVPDELTGGVETGPQISTNEANPVAFSMRDRTEALNAHGNIVFGLNNRRHG